jgi:uncharacterized membrane protein YvbJ
VGRSGVGEGDRFCRNCGRELGRDDRFCPRCGRPAHETTAVSTPEADVPLPPPSQQAGRGAPPQPQQGNRSEVRRGIAIGCAISFVLFVVFVLLLPVIMRIL